MKEHKVQVIVYGAPYSSNGELVCSPEGLSEKLAHKLVRAILKPGQRASGVTLRGTELLKWQHTGKEIICLEC